MAINSVSVFCGSSPGAEPSYGLLAHELGTYLASQDITLVFGGSDAGLMGIVADAHARADGQVIGVYPDDTFSRDVAHDGLSELRRVTSMHERKAVMYELSDAVIALPGGYGTLEELFEALTWTQLGLHALPAVVLDTAGFWDPFVTFLDGCVEAGFLKPRNRDLLGVAHSPDQALSALRQIDVAYHAKWS